MFGIYSNLVSNLMINSWRATGMDVFANYFEKTWVRSQENQWFEGVSYIILEENNI